MATTTKNKDIKNESIELSDDTLELMLFKETVFNKEFMGRILPVVDYRWFRTPHLRIMAQLALAWFRAQGTVPTRDVIQSFIERKNEKCQIESSRIDLKQSLYDFNRAKELDLAMDEPTRIRYIQNYVKREALRNALLDSASDLEKKNTDGIVENTLGKFDEIQKILFEEIDFGFELDNETVEDTMDRHMDFLTNPGAVVSTGWQCLDDVTRGGFVKDGRTLYVFMGQAGIGKSNILSNIGYNLLKQGTKVVLFTMEMSENVYLRRFDSLITKVDIDDLGISGIAPTVRERMTRFFRDEHPDSQLFIKEYPTGSISARNMENYLDKLIEQRGVKPGAIIVDYLNIVKPNGGSGSGESNMYEDGKAVSEELRALSYKYEVPVITAVQCNSSGFNTADIGMENIAQSRGIAHTADFIAGLYQTEDEQADGIFHMKILKSRFGDKSNFTFNFNRDTMEFTEANSDIPPESDADSTKSVVASAKKQTSCQVDEFDRDLFGSELGFNNDLGMP